MSCRRNLFLLITICLSVFVIMACSKKQEQEAQKTAPPVATIPDTLISAPVDTIPLLEEEVKPEVVSSPDGKYTVQVSSWQTRQKADRIAQRFRDKGYDAYVQSAYLTDRKETWYRVRVGRYATNTDAAQAANEIRDLLESGYWIDRVKRDN